MATERRIEALRDRHADLARLVEAEEHQLFPDANRLAVLKKHKLALKDMIVRAERDTPSAAHA